MKSPVSVVFEEEKQQSAAYLNGAQIGECEYRVREGAWFIVHTGVRPAYEGQGIARRLVEKVIEAAREKQVKLVPLCSYAKRMMAGKEQYQDVLLETDTF